MLSPTSFFRFNVGLGCDFLAMCANAGQYIATYTGGNTDWTRAGVQHATGTPNTNLASQYGGCPGSTVAHAYGPITASLDWVGDGDPPQTVVVLEETIAHSSGYDYNGGRYFEGHATTGVAGESLHLTDDDSPLSSGQKVPANYHAIGETFHVRQVCRPPGDGSRFVPVQLFAWIRAEG